MPTINLTRVELWNVLSAVSDGIEETERFLADVDPQRVDAQRAVRDLELLQSAKKKLEFPNATD
jgi:hypothetical protein